MASKYDSGGKKDGSDASSSNPFIKKSAVHANSDSEFDESDSEKYAPVTRSSEKAPGNSSATSARKFSTNGGEVLPSGVYQPDESWKMHSRSYSDRHAGGQPSPTGSMAWLGFGCCLFALACLLLSFCSPYWLQTWPMSENRFRNIGLWEVCFHNYMHFKDDSQQVYSGCWWLFDRQPKYYKLREWLTPPWFISCQVLTTGCLIVEIGTAITTALIFLHFCPLLNHEYLQTYGIFASASMMFFVTMVTFVVAVLFGVQINDRYWLPRPDQNFLSWGFGFLIISGIFALFAGVCLFKAGWETYQLLLRKEDEYTEKALQASLQPPIEMDVMDYGGPNYPILVAPGSSAIRPPSYSLPDNRRDSYPRPVQVGTTYSSQLPNDEIEEPVPVASSYMKPYSYDCELPNYSTTTDLAPFSSALEPSRDFGFPTGPDELPRQPAAFGGKSYMKSYERQTSESSFVGDDMNQFAPKIERQY